MSGRLVLLLGHQVGEHALDLVDQGFLGVAMTGKLCPSPKNAAHEAACAVVSYD
jgi:hypothetical protein